MTTLNLWRFTRNLLITNAETPRHALTQAIAEYHGDLAHGHGDEWAEPLHRRAVDTYARRADEHQHHGELEEALAVLDRALELNPHNEDLDQRARYHERPTDGYIQLHGCDPPRPPRMAARS